MSASSSGDFEQAESSLNQALAVRPRDPILRQHLAENYRQQGELQSAIAHLTVAVEHSPDDPKLLTQLGSLYLDNGQWIAANRFANRALDIDRKCPEAWELLAETRLANGELRKSLANFQMALSLVGGNPEIEIRIAHVQRLLGRPLRAFSTVETMLARIPTAQQPETALLLAGDLLMEIDQPLQASEKFQLASSRSDASAEAHLRLCNAQLALGQPSQARLTLARASEQYPGSQLIAQQIDQLQQSDQGIVAVASASEEIIR